MNGNSTPIMVSQSKWLHVKKESLVVGCCKMSVSTVSSRTSMDSLLLSSIHHTFTANGCLRSSVYYLNFHQNLQWLNRTCLYKTSNNRKFQSKVWYMFYHRFHFLSAAWYLVSFWFLASHVLMYLYVRSDKHFGASWGPVQMLSAMNGQSLFWLCFCHWCNWAKDEGEKEGWYLVQGICHC